MKKLSIILVIAILSVLPALLEGGESKVLHNEWDLLLQKHVKDGTVNYKGFAADSKRFNGYLDSLYKADISDFSRREKLAFWINAYNAYTIKLILDNYPLKSIRDLSRPWKQKICRVTGKTVSLDHIEHKILRKELKEPRIHFAIVCASIGCPDLQPFAFRGEPLFKQLQLVAKQFFSTPKHFTLKVNGKKAIISISKIFKWFGDDFGDNKKEKVDF
ncbi:MAG: DUF547 domain-containing protein, partial [bacterium]|nr:DUF547 domain-containing protein [bacterium]